MTFSSAFHGTTNSISSRKTSRRVFFLLPAYSASAKLIWPIASTPLPDSTSHGVIGGLVQTFPKGPVRAGRSGGPDFQRRPSNARTAGPDECQVPCFARKGTRDAGKRPGVH